MPLSIRTMIRNLSFGHGPLFKLENIRRPFIKNKTVKGTKMIAKIFFFGFLLLSPIYLLVLGSPQNHPWIPLRERKEGGGVS